MNKGGKFLKKLWCCVGGSITRQFGFINWVDNVNWPPKRDSEDDVLSLSPSSERIICFWFIIFLIFIERRIRSDEGLTLETSASEYLFLSNGGYCTSLSFLNECFFSNHLGDLYYQYPKNIRIFPGIFV